MAGEGRPGTTSAQQRGSWLQGTKAAGGKAGRWLGPDRIACSPRNIGAAYVGATGSDYTDVCCCLGDINCSAHALDHLARAGIGPGNSPAL